MTFICGQAGVYAIGAVVAKHAGDERLLGRYLTKFKEVLSCIFFTTMMMMIPIIPNIK